MVHSKVVRASVTGWCVLFLALLLLLVDSTSAYAAVSATLAGDDQALDSASSLHGAGILSEWDPAQGVPQEYVTRGQLAIMLARALGLSDSTGSYYSDVPSSADCFGAVGALHEAGLIRGPTADTFAPDETISRRWTVLWIMEALGYKLSQGPVSTTPYRFSYFESPDSWLGGFKDRTMLGEVCARAAANAYRLGVIEAADDGCFYPILPVSWGDAVVMLDKAFVRPISIRTEHPQSAEAVYSYPQLKAKSEGPLVWYVQNRLAELKYFPGEVDGAYQNHTRDAVLAFQKVERLKRTGKVDEVTLRRLFVAETPAPKLSDQGTRVEVDLTRQVLFMVTDNKVWKIVHVSTGRSGTRTGHFSIGSKYKGNVRCVTVDGVMYYPSYVVSRTAIHGYPSVPTYPASHGCIRVPMWIAEQLWHETPTGTVVDIYYNRQ